MLLVSNIPPNLANPDSLFYAFEKFGSVVRVKILHNKRNTALIQVLSDNCFGTEATTCFLQMSCHAEAQQAIDEQGKLNRVGTDIYVNFRFPYTQTIAQEQEKM